MYTPIYIAENEDEYLLPVTNNDCSINTRQYHITVKLPQSTILLVDKKSTDFYYATNLIVDL